MVLLTLGFATGYSAFSTNISLNAKGNIKQKAIRPYELKEKVITTGDGLYSDSIEQGRYIYKGANPDNYLKLDNDLYRIIYVDSDNFIKLIKCESIGSKDYDNNERFSDDTTNYCGYTDSISNYKGCNIWGSKTSMLDSFGNNISQMTKNNDNSILYNLPEKDASLNIYLNETWFNSLTYKTLIQSHEFNVGTIFNETSITNMINDEKAYKWRGFVGLINESDYINSNTNITQCSTRALINSNKTICKETTWLLNSDNLTHTLGTFYNQNASQVNGPNLVIYISNDGSSYSAYALGTRDVRPVFFLSSDIKLKGFGTQSNPYYIVDE